MLLQVKDGFGQTQIVIVAGQESPVDQSGVIAADGVKQTLLAANADRAGVLFRNTGANAMKINELGGDPTTATATGNGSWTINPTEYFPPPGFAMTMSQWNIVGSAGDTFVCREWSTTLAPTP